MAMKVDTAQALWTWQVNDTDGIGGGAVETMGQLNLSGYRRVVGQLVQDVAGTLTINFRTVQGGAVVETFVVAQDLGHPNFTYTYDQLVRAPYVEITFTNGGAASAFLRAHNEALPV